VGANDGGSSVGLLLELARVFSQRKPDFSLWFVFFDGEEAQKAWTPTDSLYGSRYFVQRLRASGQTGRIKAMILMDMVGDKDLMLENDLSSTPWLMGLVRDTATELGLGEHLSGNPKAILDDHIPFTEVGIPAVDLIDFEFGPNNRYWHTPQAGGKVAGSFRSRRGGTAATTCGPRCPSTSTRTAALRSSTGP